jgi:hypothetical protein
MRFVGSQKREVSPDDEPQLFTYLQNRVQGFRLILDQSSLHRIPLLSFYPRSKKLRYSGEAGELLLPQRGSLCQPRLRRRFAAAGLG